LTIEAGDIFKFRVGVEGEGGMIRVGEAEGMEFLEVCDELWICCAIEEL
jgi:hypothetical protein